MNATTAAARPAPSAGYVLFYRKNRWEPWTEMASAATTGELIAVMSKGPSGEYLDLPRGQHPNGLRAIQKERKLCTKP